MMRKRKSRAWKTVGRLHASFLAPSGEQTGHDPFTPLNGLWFTDR